MVLGTGPVGIATVMCLQAMRFDKIMVVGCSSLRNEIVKSLGVDEVHRSSDENLVNTAKILFEGYLLA
jgi:threonine dehydrogenase-like Zn-dependent dehydrogenase